MPEAGIRHLPPEGGLEFVRRNDLYMEVVEGKISEFCLSLVLSPRLKTFCTIFLFFYLFILP